LGIEILLLTITQRVRAGEFSFPRQRSPVAPPGVGIEVGGGVFGDAFDDDLVVGFVVIEERQLFCPVGVERVVFVGGRPRCVFTGPELVSLRWTKSSRSARRCACSARATFSVSSLIR
jgi:hypothetical protein